MTKAGNSQIIRTITLLITIFSLSLPAYAKYSGGTGEPNDPYQIATAQDLMLLGETLDDYDKHFILIADIDMDPNLPGRRVFDKAVIAPDMNDVYRNRSFNGTPFTGVFDGNNHNISNLTIDGVDYLGLFGKLASGTEVKDLAVVDLNITCLTSMGYVHNVGGLVGYNSGTVTCCYSSGSVTSERSTGYVSREFGGLVGRSNGNVTRCHSSVVVSGESYVGGLVGSNFSPGSVTQSYSAGSVRGSYGKIGGLIGYSSGHVTHCYSTAEVSGFSFVGGLVGYNFFGAVNYCYSIGMVRGNRLVGGLVGSNYDQMSFSGQGIVTQSFWDIDISGQVSSAGGVGLTTEQMQDIQTYLDAGWDWIGEIENGTSEIWQTPEGGGYPVLAIFSGYMPIQLDSEQV
ncbi:MAG TPA: hypothetical protein DIU00_01830 [Phycisphaerales bacterium]|nr:hypothetical protein [Phycisphaerales bacterium]